MHLCTVLFCFLLLATSIGAQGCPPHNQRTHICCEGVVQPRSGGRTGCCGQVSFNPNTHICCSRVIQSKRGGKTKCCGKVSYKPNSHICCDRVVQSKRGGKKKCCGQVSYKPNSHICCGRVVQSKRGGKTECCGQVSYNPNSHICCGGVVQSKRGGKTECCEQVSYNPNSHVCCGGELNPKSSNACQSPQPSNIERVIVAADDSVWTKAARLRHYNNLGSLTDFLEHTHKRGDQSDGSKVLETYEQAAWRNLSTDVWCFYLELHSIHTTVSQRFYATPETIHYIYLSQS